MSVCGGGSTQRDPSALLTFHFMYSAGVKDEREDAAYFLLFTLKL